jgi:hypothetical protein
MLSRFLPPPLPPPQSWYPGHMTQFSRILPNLLARTDVVLELRDARLPLSSVNRNFEGERSSQRPPFCRAAQSRADDNGVFAALGGSHVLSIYKFLFRRHLLWGFSYECPFKRGWACSTCGSIRIPLIFPLGDSIARISGYASLTYFPFFFFLSLTHGVNIR